MYFAFILSASSLVTKALLTNFWNKKTQGNQQPQDLCKRWCDDRKPRHDNFATYFVWWLPRGERGDARRRRRGRKKKERRRSRTKTQHNKFSQIQNFHLPFQNHRSSCLQVLHTLVLSSVSPIVLALRFSAALACCSSCSAR